MNKFDYELRDSRDNNYLASMWDKKDYALNDLTILPDSLIHKNNSKRLRICFIEAIVETFGETTILYITPTKKEYTPKGKMKFKNSVQRINGVDWSGSEWLYQ